MITRVQSNNFGAYKSNTNKVSRAASTPNVSSAVSFKRNGSELYEETVSLINEAREKAMRLGAQKLVGHHPDGAEIEFTPTKRGMSLRVANANNKEFFDKYGIGCAVETKDCWVVWSNQCPSFLLREEEEGTFDEVVQKYLPIIL